MVVFGKVALASSTMRALVENNRHVCIADRGETRLAALAGRTAYATL